MEHIAWASPTRDTLYWNPCVTWQRRVWNRTQTDLYGTEMASWKEVNSRLPPCVVVTTECDPWCSLSDLDDMDHTPFVRSELC